MRIFTRNVRRPKAPPAAGRTRHAQHLDDLVTSIADSQARQLLITDRIAAGRAEPGDEARLRIQREITASYRKRLERISLPTGVGDDAEAWLHSVTASADTRQSDSH